ncbi:MAG TPA: hypothetical protein VK186_19685 [Candidatus Deferrimicrobium sp.]|nr:hypothetical protein [Candidatus Deferrimicrobium sp.]
MLEPAKFESGQKKLGEISLSSLDREFIKEMQDIIEKNIANPAFSVAQMAKKLYMSRVVALQKDRCLNRPVAAAFYTVVSPPACGPIIESRDR